MPRGTWQAIVRRKGHRPQIQTFDAKQDAKQWARLIESEIDRAVFVDRGPSERVTIQELADRYSRDILPKKKSSGSIQRGLRFACRLFGAYTLATLQPKDIAPYRDARIASGTADAMVVTVYPATLRWRENSRYCFCKNAYPHLFDKKAHGKRQGLFDCRLFDEICE